MAARTSLRDYQRELAARLKGAGGGRATFAWDGRDRVGAQAASGLYLLEVLAASGRDAQRFVLLRR